MTSQPNLSLINGILCLEMIATSEKPLGIRPLSRMVGMNHTKVNRLVSTLAEIGLVEQNHDRKYQIGPGLHVLSTNTLWGSKLLPISLKHIIHFISHGFTVAIGVLWKDKVSYLLHKSPGQELEESLGTYQLAELERSSIGMILHARTNIDSGYQPNPENYQNLNHEITEFKEELAIYAKQQYAVRKFKNGVISIGVTIGKIPFAGLAVSSPYLSKSHIKEISKKLINTADKITQELKNRKTVVNNPGSEDESRSIL